MFLGFFNNLEYYAKQTEFFLLALRISIEAKTKHLYCVAIISMLLNNKTPLKAQQ